MKVEINTIWKVAGRDLGWSNTWSWKGIGIALQNFKEEEVEIEVKELNKKFKIKSVDAKKFIKVNNSFDKRGRYDLGVLPIKWLVVHNLWNKEFDKTTSGSIIETCQKEIQLKLFDGLKP